MNEEKKKNGIIKKVVVAVLGLAFVGAVVGTIFAMSNREEVTDEPVIEKPEPEPEP